MSEFPLKKAISEYAGKHPARFHMPGHKGSVSVFDVTEITGTDNLHFPSGAILESELLCAEALGAADAHFLVNGSTAGNLVMLSLLPPQSRVLLGRNCHRSVINGLALTGHECFGIFPDSEGIITAEQVADALDKHPCDAVFITSPTYRGAVCPIDEIASAAHERGALLFVDCAHGAHFAFSDRLPPVPSHADAWCVSTHKTLAALTQTAVLLTGRSLNKTRWEVERALDPYQSTSPSYELMLSIESAVLAPDDWDRHVERILGIRKKLASIPRIRVVGSGDGVAGDPTRIVITAEGMSGYALSAHLERLNVFPEMADSEAVTLITTPRDPDEWYDMLINALADLPESTSARPFPAFRSGDEAGAFVGVREAVMGKAELVPLSNSVGRICSCAAGCYPPGTAVLFPGERISKDAVDFLSEARLAGAELFGLFDEMAAVLKEDE